MIDKIFHTSFYINLDRSNDRNFIFKKKYNNKFNELIRISAIDGEKINNNKKSLV